MGDYRTSKLTTALTNKGFRQVSSHHFIFWYWHNGKKTPIKTFVSKGEKKYSDWHFKQRKGQIKLKTDKQLNDFIVLFPRKNMQPI
jgi:hypothetical protein